MAFQRFDLLQEGGSALSLSDHGNRAMKQLLNGGDGGLDGVKSLVDGAQRSRLKRFLGVSQTGKKREYGQHVLHLAVEREADHHALALDHALERRKQIVQG